MAFYSVRRAWTSLLVVGIPTSLLSLFWAMFMGGRASMAVLSVAYLMIVASGRAQSAHRERRERPHREARVATQLERIRSTLPEL
jgi:hypothetical protein